MKQEEFSDEEASLARPLVEARFAFTPQIISPAHRICYWLWLLLGSYVFLGSLFPSPFTTALSVVQVNEASASWTLLADEGLQLFAYFSEDLGGGSKSSIPQKWPIEKSRYLFGPLGMCRVSAVASASACYRGFGMDMPSMIVRDLGTQAGLIGEVELPQEFGRNTEKLYQTAIKEISAVIKSDLDSMVLLDPQKVNVIIYLENMTLAAHLVFVVWIIMACIFAALLLLDLLSFFVRGTARKVMQYSSCILQFSLIILEMLILLAQFGITTIVRDHIESYGLEWTSGLMFTLLLAHWVISIIVLLFTVSYIRRASRRPF